MTFGRARDQDPPGLLINKEVSMSQKQVKKARKEYKRLFNDMLEHTNEESFRERFKLAWSILTKKNHFINKVNRRKR